MYNQSAVWDDSCWAGSLAAGTMTRSSARQYVPQIDQSVLDAGGLLLLHPGCELDLVVMILPQVHLRKPCYDFTFL